jgi:hypothetical protein
MPGNVLGLCQQGLPEEGHTDVRGQEARLPHLPQANEEADMSEATLECSKCNGSAYQTVVGLDPYKTLVLCRGCLETTSRCSCG